MAEGLTPVPAVERLPERGPPFFSIITCTRNSAEYLQETIESVEHQAYRSFEHIFIDAFSSDATVAIIKAYQARCPDQVRLHQVPASGISNAMNVGIGLARGAVILHLHGDDRLGSETVLELVRRQFAATQASIVVGNCLLTGRDPITCTWPRNRMKRALLRLFLHPFMFYSNLIPHPSTYVAKLVFERHGLFSESYKVVMDYDFWFRVLRHEEVVVMGEVLSVYRFHDETISTTQMALGLREIEQIRDKYKSDYALAYGLFLVLLRPLMALRRILKTRTSNQAPISG
jgi:glycosyltransferase involved in cell wall biosynthesis